MRHVFNLLIFLIRGGVTYAERLGVTVGKNCRIYTRNFGSEPFLIRIGNNVTVTRGVNFITHDGALCLFKDKNGRRYKYMGIDVGNNVFIGINSIIMPGVRIDDNVIVAAGSVVTKSVPGGSVVAGTPAKIIASFYDLEQRSLRDCIAEIDLDRNLPYKERVLKIFQATSKPYLSK